MTEIFQPDLAKFPHKPGVYLMEDKSGKVIYVGKAIDLKHRVGSYFQKVNQSIKTNKLVEKIAKINFIVTDTEVEALILENELIKQHTPKFNVLLRDDKGYQYIKIDFNEAFPVIVTVRSHRNVFKKDPRQGVKYFGPYTRSSDIKMTLRLISKIFPICARAENLNKKVDTSPCLNWHLGRCLGPCVGKIRSSAYQDIMHLVARFLSGEAKDTSRYLKQQMQALSDKKDFESALKVRNQINALEAILEKQKVAQPGELINQDFWGWINLGSNLVVAVLKVRQGRLIDRQIFTLQIPDISINELIGEAIVSIYTATQQNLPSEIVLSESPDKPEILETWLSQKAGKKVKIVVPQKGLKKQLVLLANKNAVEQSNSFAQANLQIKPALINLKKKFGLKKLKRMEAYDISHLGGTFTVGSMVVFIDGKPHKAGYRRFRIKTVRGVDDYASLGEMIYRRLRPTKLKDKKFATNLPDLILIDGGKGQLNTVLQQMHKLTLPEILTIGLAKQQEEIFLPGATKSIKLASTSPELYLLQRLRDEAHRFAITYQTVLRSRQVRMSSGVRLGTATRKKLVSAFGSISEAKKVSEAELYKVIGDKAKSLYNNW